MDDKGVDSFWMAKALELAIKGQSGVQPNPMVGCVIVIDGKIIGEGFHEEYGSNHAEVNAINSIPEEFQRDLSTATAYVTLEPCSHFGKTPPCADLLIEKGIGRVVTAMEDPNPKVSGQGHLRLVNAGIEVETNIMKESAEILNRIFLSNIKSTLPYITLKWAESLDGFIDPEINAIKNRGSFPISSVESRKLVHQLRASHKGILVGRKTVEVDNPRLTTRDTKGENPHRIIIDSELKINHDDLKMHKEDGETFILCDSKHTTQNSEKITFINGIENGLHEVLVKVREKGIHSILVEGGANTIQSFIDGGLWNEAFVIKSNKKIHKGLQSPKIDGEFIIENQISDDIITSYKREKTC